MNDTLISKFIDCGVQRNFAAAAVLIYLDLCEVKKYWDVTYTYNDVLKNIIFHSKKKKDGPVFTFVPVPSYSNLTFQSIQRALTVSGEETIVLAIVHPDSTMVYYEIFNGLVEPVDTPTRNLKANKQEKLNASLKKHSKLLEQAALYSIPITLAEKSGDNVKVDENK